VDSDSRLSVTLHDMPRVKVLKSVAHNIGASFTSLTNYAHDDYSLGHILRFARESGDSTLTIDLLNGKAFPTTLLHEPIAKLPAWYSDMFLRLVKSAGSDRDLICTAKLTLTFDLQRNRQSRVIPREMESPYTCDVSILTKGGKDYTAHFDGWWFIERGYLVYSESSGVVSSDRRWWNPLTWFRST
jgi:hypothetical protein